MRHHAVRKVMQASCLPHILSAACFCLVVAMSGCIGQHVHQLGDERYSPTPSNEPVKLYISSVQEPHTEIALVNSFEAGQDSPEIRRMQLEDLQRRAREIGAQAVIKVRRLQNKGHGMIKDELVPFPAPMQGDYVQFFMRGTAIRYDIVEEDADTTSETLPIENEPGPAAKTPDIPEETAPVADDSDTPKPLPAIP